jgi:hypothetical protein
MNHNHILLTAILFLVPACKQKHATKKQPRKTPTVTQETKKLAQQQTPTTELTAMTQSTAPETLAANAQIEEIYLDISAVSDQPTEIEFQAIELAPELLASNETSAAIMPEPNDVMTPESNAIFLDDTDMIPLVVEEPQEELLATLAPEIISTELDPQVSVQAQAQIEKELLDLQSIDEKESL